MHSVKLLELCTMIGERTCLYVARWPGSSREREYFRLVQDVGDLTYMPLCREVAWQLQGEGILQASARCRRLDVHASMSRGDLAAPGRGNTSG